MSIISFIEEPKTVNGIIHHPELSFSTARLPPPQPPTGAPYGSRGEWGVFLRAFLVVFCLFKGVVYLKPDGLENFGKIAMIFCC